MSDLKTNNDVLRDQAERAIGKILANLERATGTIVRSVTFREVEDYTVQRRELLRRVEIELERVPGTRWFS